MEIAQSKEPTQNIVYFDCEVTLFVAFIAPNC